MFLKYKCLIILLLFLTGNMMTEAQELIAPTDTVMAVVGDTVVSAGQDSVLALDSVPKKQTGLDAPVLPGERLHHHDGSELGLSVWGKRCEISTNRTSVRENRDEYGQ